ncbi:SAM-dependent methyltransferase [Saccharopolyspora montiporae]|uniref:SAM-dependent methyltransferase n=1 Tax=Saccharopolyspora montiporae TaxID=2781240 RepID=UPI001D14C6A1|nr:SAM-dependent methyltransferase [Saccharopolyspora sp. HNM0983]
MSESGTRLPQDIDTSTPSIARVYDVFLDGKDNFAVDREVHDRIVAIEPLADTAAQANRLWLRRAVKWLAGTAGVDQFLDVGSGLPTADNTHQIAQRANREATVVYVDNDPSVCAHGRALLTDNERTSLVAADLTKPQEVLGHPDVTRVLDFSRPIALLHCGTLHHVSDEQQPRAIMQEYVRALPDGSYVGITHFFDPADDPHTDEAERTRLSAKAREIQRGFQTAMGTCFFRGHAEVSGFFPGLQMLPAGPDPAGSGLCETTAWWPEGPVQGQRSDLRLLGGVGRKPGAEPGRV